MLYGSHFFQVLIVFLCFSFFLYSMQEGIPGNSKDQQEVKQESQLCNLPVSVLHQIASCFCEKGYIIDGKQTIYTRWKPINTLASTCKYLDRKFTVPNREIRINCMMKREEDLSSCDDFLSRVYNLLTRIVGRGGNNKIHLNLSINELANAIPAFESFIKQCATSPIVNQLTSLDLGLNGFVELPEDFAKLRALKRLFVGENQLNPTTIEQICTMTFLESLNLNGCELKGLPASFENLRLLRVLYVQGNLLTKKDLGLIQNLSNLEELHIGPNCVTLADVLRTAANLPNIKLINPERNIELGEANFEELFAALPPTVKVYG